MPDMTRRSLFAGVLALAVPKPKTKPIDEKECLRLLREAMDADLLPEFVTLYPPTRSGAWCSTRIASTAHHLKAQGWTERG